MSVKNIGLATVVAVLFGVSTANAQYVAPPAGNLETNTVPSAYGNPDLPVTPSTVNQGPITLSKWIVGTCPDCCGPIGGCGPIEMELYMGLGWSFPIQGPVFGHTLDIGWDIQGGARSLFFNTTRDAAWTADLSISNIFNQGQESQRQFELRHIIIPINNNNNANLATTGLFDFIPGRKVPFIANGPLPAPPSIFSPARAHPLVPEFKVHGVTIKDLNRTFVNLAGGREWYLYGNAEKCDGTCSTCGEGGPSFKWKAGFDVGGRYGSAKLELHETRHRTDTIGGVLIGLHSDVEVPCGCCCIFQAGVRVEWDYTFMDILQNNITDVQDVNLLFTAGVRY
jgi:hypothetical protein